MTSNVDVYASSEILKSPSDIINFSKSLASFTFVAKNSLDYNIQYPTSFCNCYVFGLGLAKNQASSTNGNTSIIALTHYYTKIVNNKYVIKVRLVCDTKFPLVAGQTYAWMLIFPDDISL